MKLYDGGRAPNPRRTRIFLAEKNISLPVEQVDLGALQHKSPAYAAVNPLMRVPALVLDDGTVITESVAICRYFEALHPDPPLFGRGALAMAQVEMWNRRLELHLLFPVSHVFRNSHPAMKEMEVPQVPAWAEANKPRIQEFIRLLDARVEASRVCRRRCLLDRRHYRPGRRGFHEAGEACGAGRAHQSQALARRLFPRGRARRPEHAPDDRRIGRCLRLRRPVQHVFFRRVGEGHAPGRLRCHLAGRAQGARPRSQSHRWDRALASARRPFRRTSVPPARCPVPCPARAAALDRGAAGHARTAGCGARSILSALHREQVALFVEGDGDRGGPGDRGAGAFGLDHRGRALFRRAIDGAAPLRRQDACSPIPATPNGSMPWYPSPTAPISSSSSATAIPDICRATSAGRCSSRGCPICARAGSC